MWAERVRKALFDSNNKRVVFSVLAKGLGFTNNSTLYERLKKENTSYYCILMKERVKIFNRKMDHNADRKEIVKLMGFASDLTLAEWLRNNGYEPYRVLLYDKKISKAKTLLEKDTPLKEIWALSGFRHPTSFYKTFIRRVGMSPALYRYNRGRG